VQTEHFDGVSDKVSVRDLQETILDQLGLSAHRFGFPYLGFNQQLIGPTEEAQLALQLTLCKCRACR
jgi:hypothetical protein